jgi:hypothetical protein
VHIEKALKLVDEFEAYLTKTHGHDDEEHAVDEGNRCDHDLEGG